MRRLDSSFPGPTKELESVRGIADSMRGMERILYETLAGRVRYERTASGMRVEIPTRKDWVAIIAVTAISGWALRGVAIVPGILLAGASPSGNQWLAMVGFLAVTFLTLAWLSWSFVGKSRLELGEIELKIERQILGFNLDTRAFRTREIRNLRYLPYSEFRIFKGFIPGVFCFEAEDKTHRFGSGVTDVEAFALLNEMLDVYEFPMERAVHYIGVRR
jgi:hypothetical protein